MDCLVTSAQATVPLHIIAKDHWPTYLDQLGSVEKKWVLTNGFVAKQGHFLGVPDASGGCSMVLAILDASDEQAVWAMGCWARALPAEHCYAPELHEITVDWSFLYMAWAMGAYHFGMHTQQDPRRFASLLCEQPEAHAEAEAWSQSIHWVRDLINMPANACHPEVLAAQARELADQYDGKWQAVVGDDLKDQFPAVHAVGRASVHPPRLVHCRFGSPQDPLIALVGKGVCFDSGGLDLKNAKGMADMKKDMAGAAHALGLAKYLLATKCPLQILLVLPIVENSVSSDAYRPGDVLTTRQGSTIEINNTDAEGRVILSDALELASAASPKLIIDFASLTGAQRVAMGTDIPSFFCNDKAFSERLMQASERCQDLLWPLPLHQPYRRHIRSAVADISNCADVPYGGSITAALFLEHFVHDGIPWVHFDLSGANASDQPARPKGGEAMGIRACAEAIATWRASLS